MLTSPQERIHYGIAIGDIDGDGKPDLVVTNYASNTVSVYRNTSTSGSITSGSFATNIDFTTGTNPIGIAIGDIDGDGKPDLAVTNAGSNTVSIYMNTSTSGSITSGSFATNVDFTTGSNPYSVARAFTRPHVPAAIKKNLPRFFQFGSPASIANIIMPGINFVSTAIARPNALLSYRFSR